MAGSGEGVAAFSPIRDRTVWLGRDFEHPRSWVIALDDSMRSEIVSAAKSAAAREVDFWHLRRETFSLPRTEALLDTALRELESGLGFTVLAGFPVDELTLPETRIAYAGVCGYLGRPIIQNGAAERMVDVRDIGREYSHRSRGYSGTALLPFHTDGTKGEPEALNYTGLLCLETAAEGGLSAIASAAALYNEIGARQPDLLPRLQRGYHHHRQGDHPEGHAPISAEPIPVFSFTDGLLHCRYNRNHMEWAAREGADLSELDRQAFATIDDLLESEGFALSMDLQKGDLQIINNSTVLHSRSEYVDAPGRKRHLLRLWLHNPEARRDGCHLVERFAPPESRFSDRPWRTA